MSNEEIKIKMLEAKAQMEKDLSYVPKQRNKESDIEYLDRITLRKKSKEGFLKFIVKNLFIFIIILQLSGCYAKRIETLENNQKTLVQAINVLGEKVLKEEKEKGKK